MATPGYLYCIFNKMYVCYGEDVYKLGNTIDIDTRLAGYCTSYIEPCEVLYLSDLLRNKDLAENLLFEQLKEYRLKQNREFFKCKIEIIKSEIINVQNIFKIYTDEDIKHNYLCANKKNNILSVNMYQQITTAHDITEQIYINNCNITYTIIEPTLEKFLLKQFLNLKNENFTIEYVEKNYNLINNRRKYLLLHDEYYDKYHKYDKDIKQVAIVKNIINTLDFDLKKKNKRIDKDVYMERIKNLLSEKNIFFRNYSNIRKIFNKDEHKLNTVSNSTINKILNNILNTFGLKIICKQSSKMIDKKKIATYYYVCDFNDTLKIHFL